MNKENAVTERLVNKVTYLDATKFALLGVFTPMEIICPKIWANPLPRMQKGHMRLTCVDQKGPFVKLNSKFDSVRPCSNESGLVCKHTNVCVHTRTIVSGLFRKQAHNEKAGKKTFSCAKSIKRKSLHRNTNLDAPVRG